MKSFIDILQIFQGGIIAILSSIATLVVSHILKGIGKISIIPQSDIEIKLFKRDQMGGQSQVNNFSEAKWAECYLALEFYNASDVPKSLRDIHISVYDKNKRKIVSDIPRDTSTGRRSAGMYITDELQILNLVPKKIIKYRLNFSAGREIEKMADQKYVYFEYKTIGGRKKRKLIKQY